MKRHKGNSFTVTVVRGICDDTTSVYINIFQYPSCQQLLIGPILNRLCHLPLVQSIWCSFSGFLSLHCGGRNHFVQSFHIWISRQEKTEGNMSNEHYTKLSGGLFNSGNSWRWEKRGGKKKKLQAPTMRRTLLIWVAVFGAGVHGCPMRLTLFSDCNSWVVNPKDNGLISLHDFLQKDFLKQSLKKKKLMKDVTSWRRVLGEIKNKCCRYRENSRCRF